MLSAIRPRKASDADFLKAERESNTDIFPRSSLFFVLPKWDILHKILVYRILHVICTRYRNIWRQKMKIEKYGVSERCNEAMRRLLLLEASGGTPQSLSRVILLPIPTARDRLHITGTDRLLCEVTSDVGDGCLVAGYGIPKGEAERMRRQGAKVFDAVESEDFLRENSYISAVGAMGYILTEIKKLPSDLLFGIVGYGRIGSALLRMLLYFGARVRVYTGKSLTRMELGECEVETVYTDYKDGASIEGVDVLINTAPTKLTALFPDGKIPDGMRVIELASGDNFGDIEGIERLPGIPDKMYPRSAGAAYFNAIENFIKEVF